MNKATCRQIYKNQRLSMSTEECISLDNQILAHLMKIDLTDVQYLHVYLSMTKFKEPDTFLFIDYLRIDFPNINLVISKSDFQTNTMINYLWDRDLILQESKWGILEPVEGTLINDKQIDMVVIPLLVADCKGNRVGYGKGYYDRFLANCKPSVHKIGISYFDVVDEIDDVQDWDIPLDSLITPLVVYNFK